MHFKPLSPSSSSAPTWVSSRLPAIRQERDSESALALVPWNKEELVGGGGEGGGEAKDSEEKDTV